MRLAAEIAVHIDVRVQFDRADRAFQAFWMVIFVVHGDALLQNVLATRCATLAEQIEIVGLAVRSAILLVDGAFSSKSSVAMRTDETLLVKDSIADLDHIGIGNGLRAFIATIRCLLDIVLIAIRLASNFVILPILERFVTSLTDKVILVIVRSERLK